MAVGREGTCVNHIYRESMDSLYSLYSVIAWYFLFVSSARVSCSRTVIFNGVFVGLVLLATSVMRVDAQGDEHALTRAPHSLNAHFIETAGRAGKGVQTYLHAAIHKFRENETSYVLSIHTADREFLPEIPLELFSLHAELSLFNEAGIEWKFEISTGRFERNNLDTFIYQQYQDFGSPVTLCIYYNIPKETPGDIVDANWHVKNITLSYAITLYPTEKKKLDEIGVDFDYINGDEDTMMIMDTFMVNSNISNSGLNGKKTFVKVGISEYLYYNSEKEDDFKISINSESEKVTVKSDTASVSTYNKPVGIGDQVTFASKKFDFRKRKLKKTKDKGKDRGKEIGKEQNQNKTTTLNAASRYEPDKHYDPNRDITKINLSKNVIYESEPEIIQKGMNRERHREWKEVEIDCSEIEVSGITRTCDADMNTPEFAEEFIRSYNQLRVISSEGAPIDDSWLRYLQIRLDRHLHEKTFAPDFSAFGDILMEEEEEYLDPSEYCFEPDTTSEHYQSETYLTYYRNFSYPTVVEQIGNWQKIEQHDLNQVSTSNETNCGCRIEQCTCEYLPESGFYIAKVIYYFNVVTKESQWKAYGTSFDIDL